MFLWGGVAANPPRAPRAPQKRGAGFVTWRDPKSGTDPDGYHLTFTRQLSQDQHHAAQWAESFDMPEHH